MTAIGTHVSETSRPLRGSLWRRFIRITFGYQRWQHLIDEMSAMSDAQLAMIGIDRFEIAAAASFLVSETDFDSAQEDDCRAALRQWVQSRQRLMSSSSFQNRLERNSG